jgi:hypothetical protein
MDIIEKLKKEKKVRSVFDVILDEKNTREQPAEGPDDIEVREIHSVQRVVEESENVDPESGHTREVREFRTEGMHEFDIESLGASNDGAIRIEYKTKVCKLIDLGEVDEAIELLKDLKAKLAVKDNPT